MSFSSTTEPRIAGFRLGREIARDDLGAVVHDAVQVELERPVTLTVLPPGDARAARFRADAWPDHPHVPGLFAAGPSASGFFIATRRIPGASTLRRRVAEGADPRGWLADVRAALVATGTVHGGLEDETSLLIDGSGRVHITGFGLAAPGTTAADDARALARLAEEAAGGARRPPRRRSRRAAAPAAAAGIALASLALWSAGRSGEDDAPPAPAPGAVALGSELAPGPARNADCDGELPTGSSSACTVLQEALPGRTLVVPRDGVVVAWHVRAARGNVALRVVRPRAAGRFAVVGGSATTAVDGAMRSFRAALPVRRGDRLGLELAPGAAAGLRDATRARTRRFIGPLGSESRTPDPARSGEELLLRVDYVPGRTLARPVQLRGAAAAGAPSGRVVDERELDLGARGSVTAALVVLPGAVAVDVVDGRRRRARIVVPGADPRGRPIRFTAKGEADLTLAWRNPDGRPVEMPFRVTATSIDPAG